MPSDWQCQAVPGSSTQLLPGSARPRDPHRLPKALGSSSLFAFLGMSACLCSPKAHHPSSRASPHNPPATARISSCQPPLTPPSPPLLFPLSGQCSSWDVSRPLNCAVWMQTLRSFTQRKWGTARRENGLGSPYLCISLDARLFHQCIGLPSWQWQP